MSDQITPREFHESEGVDDWRWVFEGACAWFATGSFAKGVDLIREIGRLADEANHHPDVDLRYGGVMVRLLSHDVMGLSHRDLALARQISAAAAALGAESDPSKVQTVQISVDALVHPDVMPFWEAVLGYHLVGDEDVMDPRGRGPSVWFQQMDKPREQRNRIHVDVCVPHDQVEARVAAALAAGGVLVADHAPTWWTLADAEGNECDVTSWLGRFD